MIDPVLLYLTRNLFKALSAALDSWRYDHPTCIVRDSCDAQCMHNVKIIVANINVFMLNHTNIWYYSPCVTPLSFSILQDSLAMTDWDAKPQPKNLSSIKLKLKSLSPSLWHTQSWLAALPWRVFWRRLGWIQAEPGWYDPCDLGSSVLTDHRSHILHHFDWILENNCALEYDWIILLLLVVYNSWLCNIPVTCKEHSRDGFPLTIMLLHR